MLAHQMSLGDVGLESECMSMPALNAEPHRVMPPDAASSIHYGGFWRRLAAFIIDFLTMLVPLYLLTLVLAAVVSTDAATLERLSSIVSTAFWWLYFALMESSSWQASIGKRAMSLRVTDSAGERLSLLRALLRFAAKYLSLVPLGIGFLLVGWTRRKQGLHDLIVRTCVVHS